MNKNRLKLNHNGFGLMEVMISMIVLAIGLLGLAPMITLSIHGNCISRDNTVVSELLRQKVEQFEGTTAMPAMPYQEYEEGLDDIYNRTTYISDNTCDSLVPAGIYHIRVRVNWVDKRNVGRSMSYATYICD